MIRISSAVLALTREALTAGEVVGICGGNAHARPDQWPMEFAAVGAARLAPRHGRCRSWSQWGPQDIMAPTTQGHGYARVGASPITSARPSTCLTLMSPCRIRGSRRRRRRASCCCPRRSASCADCPPDTGISQAGSGGGKSRRTGPRKRRRPRRKLAIDDQARRVEADSPGARWVPR